MIDLHCHILPGIDDGARDIATSLAMAQMAQEDGITHIVATPHVSADGKPTPDEIRAATQQLNELLGEQDVPVTILPGAEVPAYPDTVALVREHKLLTIADQDKYLLLEPPLAGIPTYLEQVCFELQVANIIPVIAHPERTQLAFAQLEVYKRLVERGCLMQVNADSLRGHEGRRIRKIALELVRSRLAHIIATDAHGLTARRPQLSDVRRTVAQAADEHTFREMTELVPRRILCIVQEDNR